PGAPRSRRHKGGAPRPASRRRRLAACAASPDRSCSACTCLRSDGLIRRTPGTRCVAPPRDVPQGPYRSMLGGRPGPRKPFRAAHRPWRVAEAGAWPHSGSMPRSRSVSLPVVTEHEVAVAGLDPRLDGVRIAQLSDIHVGSMTPPEHVRAAVELANQARPDVVVMTGDYVGWRRHEVLDAEAQLAGLRARRVVAVLGNHDYFTWGAGVTAALGKNGYDVVKNGHVTLDVDG